MAIKWRDDEIVVISVTPVADRLARPVLTLLLLVTAIVEGASHVPFVRAHESSFALVFVGPIVVVLLTRTWRWRSHKVHVTTQRVILEGGVLRHWRTFVELRDVIATRVDQGIGERLARRGVVVLETGLGPIVTRRVRHPEALCRLIDAERSHVEPAVPYDTIFGFDESRSQWIPPRPGSPRLTGND
ncbi:MAG: PH domain-containing protein [Acidobacteriota bacterium]|nr:PH domain-containing protein [Acidobacteriota bacterium]